MSTAPAVRRDERTVEVENAGLRWSYATLSFGLLAVVAYRSYVWHESPWDLLALVVLGGAVSSAYQGFHRTRLGPLAAVSLLTFGFAAAVAALLAWFREVRP